MLPQVKERLNEETRMGIVSDAKRLNLSKYVEEVYAAPRWREACKTLGC